MKNCLCFFLLFFFCSAIAFAQQTKVNGVIISGEDNEPVIGASITVKGKPTIGTVTDLDGKFQLNVPAGTKTLTVSYIGFKAQDVSAKPNLKVILESDAQILDEVVVTGMQKMDKRLFTGATTKLDASKAKLDGVADVSRALEGRAAGVSVQNVSGTFGTAPKIRVRGATSIYGSSRPLWVVDGVIVEDAVDVSADDLSSGDAVTLISSAIAGLNADDIESFQILKDGSATSIYGARAMAGVVVITTKRGKVGTSTINYTGEFTTRMKPSYKNYNISNSQEQMSIYKEMQQKGWLEFASLANGASSGIYGRMYSLINQRNADGSYTLPFTDASMNKYLQDAEFRNTDWFDLLFTNKVMQNHAISISTGSERAKMYSSISALYDPGWSKQSKVERYTGNMNASFDVSKWVTLNILTSGSYRKQTAPGTQSQSSDPVSGTVSRGFDINPFSYALNTSRTMDPTDTYTRNYASFNIFDELENNYIELGITDLKFQADLSWKPVKGLEIKGLGAIRYQSTVQEQFIKDHSNQANAYRAGISPENASIRLLNPYLYTDPNNDSALPETVLPVGGMYFNNSYSIRQLDFRGTVEYNNVFNDTHILNLFGGMEMNSTDRNSLAFEGWGFCYDDGGIPAVDSKLYSQMVEENRDYYGNSWTYGRNLAFFASGNYSYKGKYSMNLTGRYEGTNSLGKARSSRWLPTYNVALAWNVHEERWFEKLQPALSHLTLKTSYSLTGDRGPSSISNALPIVYATRPWRPLGKTENALYLSNIANSELTYEKKYEYNFGVDLGFINNRINVALDAYTRNNHDLIGQTFTQGAGGVLSKYANVAKMKSRGVELTLSTRNIVKKDFSWGTDFTFSKSHNEITELNSRANVQTLITGSGFARQGYPVRSLFSIPFMGLNDEGIPTFINQDNELTTTGINFQELEKVDFLKYEGPTDPTITGGFGNILSYKNFRLNIFITYSFGNKIRLDPVFASSYSDMSALPKEFANRWTIPGDEKYTDIPAIASRRQYQNIKNLGLAYSAYNYSTARCADGGFIRMKEISLTYDLPATFVRKIGLSTASLKVQGTNLFLIYSDKKLNGQDPEFINSGGVATPMPKQFTFTIRLGI